MKRKLRKTSRRTLSQDHRVYANEFTIIPNEGWVLEVNRWIEDTSESLWQELKQGVSHIFQGSQGGLATATAGAIGMYAGGPAGAAAGVATELGASCFNCHVGQPIVKALSE